MFQKKKSDSLEKYQYSEFLATNHYVNGCVCRGQRVSPKGIFYSELIPTLKQHLGLGYIIHIQKNEILLHVSDYMGTQKEAFKKQYLVRLIESALSCLFFSPDFSFPHEMKCHLIFPFYCNNFMYFPMQFSCYIRYSFPIL